MFGLFHWFGDEMKIVKVLTILWFVHFSWFWRKRNNQMFSWLWNRKLYILVQMIVITHVGYFFTPQLMYKHQPHLLMLDHECLAVKIYWILRSVAVAEKMNSCHISNPSAFSHYSICFLFWYGVRIDKWKIESKIDWKLGWNDKWKWLWVRVELNKRYDCK